jgi:hypothetical protein
VQLPRRVTAIPASDIRHSAILVETQRVSGNVAQCCKRADDVGGLEGDMVTLATKQKRKPSATRIKLEHVVRKELDGHCHFRGRVNGFQFQHRDGVLTVRGRVPSFYLRQLLEKVLKRIDGVQRINNQVDVVCCDGLSSVRNESANP